MRWNRNLIPRFALRHVPAGARRIAVLAALSIFGCQGPPEEASTVAASTALLDNGAVCTANGQCSSGVCSGGVCVASPDLVVTSITGVPAQVSAQQLVAASWTVRNQGAAAAHGSTVPCCSKTDQGSYQYNNLWFDRFFLSTDAALDADDVFVGEYARPDNFTLAAGASYTVSASIHVPSVAAGFYYLILVTDGFGNRVPESDDTNNTIAVPVTVGQADLVATSLTGVPGQAAAQQLLPVSWTVTNQATTGAASGSRIPCRTQTDHGSYQYNNLWFDRFFLSTDATLSADDTFIGEYARPDNFTLAAGASYAASASIHVPTVAPGAYYLIVVTDGYGDRVPESNESNNTSSVPITVGQADLAVAAVTGMPAQVSSQQLVPMAWTVTNLAASGAASGSLVPCCTKTDHGSYQYNNLWFDRFFVSTDATLSADDTAQEIVVTDALPSTLDWSTLHFTAINYGGRKIVIPSGAQSFSQLDLPPIDGCVLAGKGPLGVNVSLGFNSSTGVITLHLTVVDTTTGGFPADAAAGILPPSTACTGGSLEYSVLPLEADLPGTVITNQASIVFDSNSPIVTNQVSNTIAL